MPLCWSVWWHGQNVELVRTILCLNIDCHLLCSIPFFVCLFSLYPDHPTDDEWGVLQPTCSSADFFRCFHSFLLVSTRFYSTAAPFGKCHFWFNELYPPYRCGQCSLIRLAFLVVFKRPNYGNVHRVSIFSGELFSLSACATVATSEQKYKPPRHWEVELQWSLASSYGDELCRCGGRVGFIGLRWWWWWWLGVRSFVPGHWSA